jgi:hypothetical protein
MTEVSTEVSGETTRTLRYLRSQIFSTSKFSLRFWLTTQRDFQAKMDKTAETHRPQALPYRLRRSLKVKFLCLSVYLCTFGLRSGVAAQELALSSPRFTRCNTVCLETPSLIVASSIGRYSGGACCTTLACSSLVIRICQGAPGVTRSPAMKRRPASDDT